MTDDDVTPRFKEPNPEHVPWVDQPRSPLKRHTKLMSKGLARKDQFTKRAKLRKDGTPGKQLETVNRRGRTSVEQTAYNGLRAEILRMSPMCGADGLHTPECVGAPNRGRANALQHIIPKRKPYNGPDVEWNLMPVHGGITGSGSCHHRIDHLMVAFADGYRKFLNGTAQTHDPPLLWLQDEPDGGWTEPPWASTT